VAANAKKCGVSQDSSPEEVLILPKEVRMNEKFKFYVADLLYQWRGALSLPGWNNPEIARERLVYLLRLTRDTVALLRGGGR
jgi:hypothetical protein